MFEYAGWVVYAGEICEDNILGSEAKHCDVEASLANYEAAIAAAIRAEYPGMEIIHENNPGSLGETCAVYDPENERQDNEECHIDQLIAAVFESGSWVC